MEAHFSPEEMGRRLEQSLQGDLPLWRLTGSLKKILGSKAMWGTDKRTVRRSGWLMPELLHQGNSPQNPVLELARLWKTEARTGPGPLR